MANHSSILAWRISCTKEPGRLQSTYNRVEEAGIQSLYAHASEIPPIPESKLPKTLYKIRYDFVKRNCSLQVQFFFVGRPFTFEFNLLFVNSSSQLFRDSVPTYEFGLCVQLSHPYMTTGKTIALIRQTFVSKVMSLLFNKIGRAHV